MRICCIALLAVCVFALPAAAGGHSHHRYDRHDRHDHDFRLSGHTELEVEGDVLVITHESRRADDEVTISRDGKLKVNGRRIETDHRDREQLARLYDQARELEDMAEDIAADAEEIAGASTAFAANKIAAVLRSLRDEDDDEAEARYADLDEDFEDKIARIEEFADDIEDRADAVMDLAEELQDRIPALRELDWFLDD